MAKIYNNSSEARLAELALFRVPPTNVSVLKKVWRDVRPDSQITRHSPITFSDSGAGLEYKYFKKSRLYLKCRIATRTGAIPNEGDTVFPINNLLNSLWSSIEVKLGSKLITQNNNNFAYKSFIKTLLYRTDSPSEVAKLGPEMFHMDTVAEAKEYPAAMDSLTMQPYNAGAMKRKALTAGGKSFQLEGCLATDLFGLPKYLINGVKWEIKLTPNRSEFILMTDNPDAGYELVIEDAVLKLCVIDIANSILTAQNGVLERAKKAEYFFPKTEIRSFSVAQGLHSAYYENVFSSVLPHKVVCVFVDGAAYSGSYSRNPINFAHNNLKRLTCFLNGQTVPSTPMSLDYENGMISNALTALYDNTNTCLITTDNFSQGLNLYCFDLCTEADATDEFEDRPLCLEQTGTIRIEAEFSKPLPNSVQLLVYGEFVANFNVDTTRNVSKEA